jgi:indole-3-glycerol phosphate synthase
VSRLSQAIAEGNGISVLVEVSDGKEAGSAEEHGADALVVRTDAGDVHVASQLPVLLVGQAEGAGAMQADAIAIPADLGAWDAVQGLGVECVVQVSDPDELEHALEELDPEVFLLTPDPSSEVDALEMLLTLLHDVPAGKLAIAELKDASADDVAELERAGVDAVLVAPGAVAALVPAAPPEV